MNMAQADHRLRPDSSPDPFNERAKRLYRDQVRILGGVFEFESSSRALQRLVHAAYSGLPPHRLPGRALRFQVRLQPAADNSANSAMAPPPTSFQGGAGLLTAVMDPANFAVACPASRSGLVAISNCMLRFPEQVRYELLEFVVFTLAHRGQGLVSLHAACVGWRRRGLLLMGESGAGKSVLALHCALQGLDFLTEDATFVAPGAMLATGVSNFLHVKVDSLQFLDDATIVSRIRKSPVIRRRSGVEKFEIDMRRFCGPPVRTPLTLAGVVFVSKSPAGKSALLRALNRRDFLARLESSQPYAANQPNWQEFMSRASALPALELRRGAHPAHGVEALRALLGR
jgi:hypothetical protein